jgi:hypothetical protein
MVKGRLTLSPFISLPEFPLTINHHECGFQDALPEERSILVGRSPHP